MNPLDEKIQPRVLPAAPPTAAGFWQVEGSLLNLGALRPVAFIAWNAQSFSGRWARLVGVGLLALARPILYLTHRIFATRMLYAVLRGVSKDRLDLLGEEYFHYVLKPRLKPRGVEKLKELMATSSGGVILMSHGLDHIVRPLAEFLGVERVVANRLEFREGLATGRLLEPVIRPRSGLAWLVSGSADGRISLEQLCRDLGFADRPEVLHNACIPSQRQVRKSTRPIVVFDPRKRVKRLSVRESLAGKHVLLIGVTGFIGKVWLAKVLSDLPEIGRIYLLIRRKGQNTGWRRFEKIVEESPVFDALYARYGTDLVKFLGERVEVVEGDVSQSNLGIEPETVSRLRRKLDLVVNSSGLTDFNPDIGSALATNVDATIHILDFLRRSDHAGMLHLSTCYVVGARDGRVSEELRVNYTPTRAPDFDVERERQALHALVKEAEARAESGLDRDRQMRKSRVRWLRSHLTEAGTRRAKELGWPNTYTYTKSLAESLIQKLGADLPVAVVRPSIVETSVQQPFTGWNEGINTSAPLSYLLGTYFRQLPSNERKCLDLIPVDLVCRGMTLVAAAIVERCHERLYHLATSANNPCDMRRSIELTSLAHRKHYRAQEGLEHWLRLRFDAISVSKARYQKLSAPGQKAMVRFLKRLISPIPLVRSALERRERNLERVEKLIELYEPFILHNEHVFEAQNVDLLSAALPPEEREAFGYDADSIDWWDYWINIHVPALRKWVYPLIEGRPLESRPRHSLPLPVGSATGAPESPTARPGDPTRRTETSWPYS